MRCHKDTLLYKIPQYEVVYTITNSSDSYTKWYTSSQKISHVFTKPNSLLIIKAAANTHCVSRINYGTRSILKFIYTQTNQTTHNYHNEFKRFS